MADAAQHLEPLRHHLQGRVRLGRRQKGNARSSMGHGSRYCVSAEQRSKTSSEKKNERKKTKQREREK